MIKYIMNKGDVTELELNGDMAEIVADFGCLYQVLYEQYFEGLGRGGANYFAKSVRHIFDKIEKEVNEEHGDTSPSPVEALIKDIITQLAKRSYADAEGFNEDKDKG